jgi:hypothetical protein
MVLLLCLHFSNASAHAFCTIDLGLFSPNTLQGQSNVKLYMLNLGKSSSLLFLKNPAKFAAVGFFDNDGGYSAEYLKIRKEGGIDGKAGNVASAVLISPRSVKRAIGSLPGIWHISDFFSKPCV